MSDEMKFGPVNLTAQEKARLANYNVLQDLLGKKAKDHDPLYKRDLDEAKNKSCVRHLWVGIPSMVCRAAADLILPEAPRVAVVDDDENGTIQARVDAILKRSAIYKLSWKALYWTCALGDGALVVSDIIEKGQSLPLITFRRATNSVARNIRTEDSPATRQFVFKSCDGGLDIYLEHTAQHVKWYAYKGNDPASVPEKYKNVETGEDIPLVIPMVQLRGDESDEAFGESDFEGAPDFCFEISNRLRQVSKILDRHAEPPMNVPGGTLDENNQHDARNKKVYERGDDGEGAEYLSWQSQLQEAYSEIDKLTDIILLLTETPGALWGRDKDGAVASGRALKFKMLSGIGKARRTGGMFKEALAAAVRLALRREDILKKQTPAEYNIRVTLSEDFVLDLIEQGEYAQKLRSAMLLTIKRGVEMTQPHLTSAEVDEEVAALEAEVSASQTPPIGADSNRF